MRIIDLTKNRKYFRDIQILAKVSFNKEVLILDIDFSSHSIKLSYRMFVSFLNLFTTS